jgi:hypothetical protein
LNFGRPRGVQFDKDIVIPEKQHAGSKTCLCDRMVYIQLGMFTNLTLLPWVRRPILASSITVSRHLQFCWFLFTFVLNLGLLAILVVILRIVSSISWGKPWQTKRNHPILGRCLETVILDASIGWLRFVCQIKTNKIP